jgi:thiol-disulfide isomerase/thioredoxin
MHIFHRRRFGQVMLGGLSSAMAGLTPGYADTPDANGLTSADKDLDLTIPVMAPDLVFTDVAGRNRSLSQYIGQKLVVNLWATWCSPCLAELPTLDLFNQALAKSDIRVLPICVDQASQVSISDLFHLMGIISLPILMNQSTTDLEAFGGTGIPATMIINAKGMIVATATGAADWSTDASIAAVKRLCVST